MRLAAWFGRSLTHSASACRSSTPHASKSTGWRGGLRLSVGYVGSVPSTHGRASLVEHAPQNAMDDPDEIERFWPRSFAVAS